MALDDGRVVSNFIAQVSTFWPRRGGAWTDLKKKTKSLRGEPMTIMEPGTQTRSFTYVADLVDGLMKLMEGEHTGPINLGNPVEFTIAELAETIKEHIVPGAQIKYIPNTPDDPKQRKPIITKAQTLLGWEPTIQLKDGLVPMAIDIAERLNLPLPENLQAKK